MSRILIIEDEETIAELEKDCLELSGFDVEIENDGSIGLERSLKEDFDLFILDLMLPGTDGFEICRHIRETKNIPVLMVSAKKEDIDKIRGLGLGADDYITKPYSIRNVLARIRAVLRRTVPPKNKENQPTLEHKGLKVYPESKMCVVDGNEIKLPKKEFEILSLMIANKGKIFTREELLSRIWPEQVVVVDRVVDVNITRLRSKIGTYGKNIVTRSGYGYGFQV